MKFLCVGGSVGAGPGMTKWIGILPIFARPNKVQLSIGAVKVMWVPGGSLRRFGSSIGSSINPVQVLLGDYNSTNYTESEYMKKYLSTTIKDVTEINKTFKPIWEFTYKISGGEEERIRLVKRDPDNLLVSWIPYAL